MGTPDIGISGFSAYVPPYRVNLQTWCDWTGESWDKTRAVIGNSFRVVGPDQSIYTMAANAVLKLIVDYGIDPRRVGYLAVGTESGTDNATSAAVVVRGLVDDALKAMGKPMISRDCEAPEFKQACLGGVYGLKGAMRYLAFDGVGRLAIVVASDIAEYERGSSGEPTQGAGAVAMLMEENPKLLSLDLKGSGGATSYRALDFRKPFLRYCGQSPGRDGRPRDYPVFNGKYSTACYIDETLAALDSMFAKRGGSRSQYFRDTRAVFMHRPYRRMPVAAWAMGYIFALGADTDGQAELGAYCAKAKLDLKDVLAEMKTTPDLVARAVAGELVEEAYPLCALAMKAFKESPVYQDVVENKMRLGAAVTSELGNLYSAALPAWLAAGLEDAASQGVDLAGKPILLIGYGSGDASEVIPAKAVPGWEALALKSDFANVLKGAVDISREQYEALHDGFEVCGFTPVAPSGFTVQRIGGRHDHKLQDVGIEYYRYTP